MITSHLPLHRPVSVMARTGLVAKGVVYCLLGVLAVKSAMGAGSAAAANKEGALNWVEAWPAGKVILACIGLGILCYCAWRFTQAARGTDKRGWKDAALRARYTLSGLLYLTVALFAWKGISGGSGGGSGSGGWQSKATGFLGHWAVYVAAGILAAVGIYQVIYSLSGRYKKHVDELRTGDRGSRVLLQFGRIGYIARGLVWLTIGFLLFKGAVQVGEGNDSTGQAFQFLGKGTYGPYILGGVAAGLICYGLFCFVRARYESARQQEG